MRRKGGLGFLPVRPRETAEEKFLGSLDLSNRVVYDIGGFEGVLTLFFASRAAKVITYEPNPRNHRCCIENVKLNNLSNVRVLNRGLFSQAGQLEMTFDPLMPGAASANKEVCEQIESSVATTSTVSITVETLDSEIETLGLPPPDFIKIDIEGMELEALRGMSHTLATHHPELFIELHGAEFADKTANASAVIELLERTGYRIYDIENQKYLTCATLDVHPPSHLYCTSAAASK